jgi:hypothetical protein
METVLIVLLVLFLLGDGGLGILSAATVRGDVMRPRSAAGARIVGPPETPHKRRCGKPPNGIPKWLSQGAFAASSVCDRIAFA